MFNYELNSFKISLNKLLHINCSRLLFDASVNVILCNVQIKHFSRVNAHNTEKQHVSILQQ